MTDYVAKYTLRFNDLASKGLLRTAATARVLSKALLATAAAGATVVLGAAAAAAKLAGAFSERADEIAKFTKETGFAADAMQRLEFITERQGGDFAVVRKGISQFNRALGELRVGYGTMETALKKLDPAFKQQLLSAENSEEAYFLLLRQLAQIPDVASRTALAAAAVGQRGAKSLLRITADGLDAIDKLEERSKFLRPAIPDSALKAAEAYQDALTDARTAMGSLGDSIGAKLMPRATELLTAFADFVATNREMLTSKVVNFFDKISSVISNISVEETGDQIRDIIGALADILPMIVQVGTAFSKFVGGPGNAIKILFGAALISKVAALAGPLLTVVGIFKKLSFLKAASSWPFALMSAFLKLKMVMVGAASIAKGALAAAFFKANMLMAVSAGIIKAKLIGAFVLLKAKALAVGLAMKGAAAAGLLKAKAALMLVGKAMLWVGRAFLMNPIGLVITAIIAAIYLLWKNWDTVKAKALQLWQFLGKVWAGIKIVFKAALDQIISNFTARINLIKSVWSAAMNFVRTAAESVWSGIKAVFAAGLNFIIDKINQAIKLQNKVANSSFGSTLGIGAVGQIGRFDPSGAAKARAPARNDKITVDISGRVKGAKLSANTSTNSNRIDLGGSNLPLDRAA